MTNIRENCLYFDLSRRERDSAIRYILGLIIKSRGQEGIPSNTYVYDEDVNVYLAHLLFAVSLPEYHDMSEPYLSTNSSELMRWVEDAEDQTIRYFIYKVNADYILIHTAVFDDLKSKGQHRFFQKSKNQYSEMAKLYYEQAAAYHKKIYRKKTGVGDVLEKIANYFDLYQGLLFHVRREYFHFVNNFKDQAFHFLMEEISHYEKEVKKRSVMDEFLDLYGQWLNSKSPLLECKILQCIQQIKKVDPEFHFDIIERFRGEGGVRDEKKCA